MWSSLKPIRVYLTLLPILLWLFFRLPLQADQNTDKGITKFDTDSVTLFVLGTVQDGGSPHPGCNKSCCSRLFDHPDTNRMVVCLGLADHTNDKSWMMEASPDFTRQVQFLSRYLSKPNLLPDGILLTHAHIGHYTGLMYLGKEAMNAKRLPIYTQPRMKNFLETNGPWSQLVKLENIILMNPDSAFNLSRQISIKTIPVPHRDEYSETVAYWIEGPTKKALFIPDIDKWEKWDRDIKALIRQVDYAFIDATFYHTAEVNYRDIREIPHPFVSESLKYFQDLSSKDKNKIYFIHLNHTNPLLDPSSLESRDIQLRGYHVARIGMNFNL